MVQEALQAVRPAASHHLEHCYLHPVVVVVLQMLAALVAVVAVVNLLRVETEHHSAAVALVATPLVEVVDNGVAAVALIHWRIEV